MAETDTKEENDKCSSDISDTLMKEQNQLFVCAKSMHREKSTR